MNKDDVDKMNEDEGFQNPVQHLNIKGEIKQPEAKADKKEEFNHVEYAKNVRDRLAKKNLNKDKQDKFVQKEKPPALANREKVSDARKNEAPKPRSPRIK